VRTSALALGQHSDTANEISKREKPMAYTIVSSAEADPWHGRISSESPVGLALLQARHGEEVRVRTPGGMRVLTIIEVTTPPS
jgi:transcription elongation GreA/GreB family factor